uniref:Uncharacterized protein n=1 Tax=Peronospora matthiolae TaxID=2874970 RepID=A0AAV1TA63_9STRA
MLMNWTLVDDAAIEPKKGASKQKSKENYTKYNVRTPVDEPVLDLENLEAKSKGMAFVDNTGRG